MADEDSDVRLWLVRLDEALAYEMPRGERRYAVKDARHVVETLAFSSANADDRLVPDDRDLANALRAVKAPRDAAPALARRRPIYRRKRIGALARTWSILLLLAGAAWAFTAFATSEEPVPLAAVAHSEPEPFTGTAVFLDFAVPENLSRVDVTVHATGMDRDDAITVTLLGPGLDVVWQKGFGRDQRLYAHENLAPRVGAWKLVVDYHEAKGAVRVDVTGVRPS